MNRIYTYPRFNLFALISSMGVIFLLAMVAKGFFAEAIDTQNLISRLVAAIIGLFFAACCGWIFVMEVVNLTALRKVITHDEDLTIQNLFSSRTILWGDIAEFGTYTAGFQYRVRRFYLKSTQFGDEQIEVCTHYLDNLRDLIDTIFLKAVNANFVIMENVATIPFTKRLETDLRIRSLCSLASAT
jgi:hypothetical protein